MNFLRNPHGSVIQGEVKENELDIFTHALRLIVVLFFHSLGFSAIL